MATIDAVWEYVTPADNQQPLPKARRYHVGVQYKGKKYIFGGQQGKDMYLNDLWAFDSVAKTWTEVATHGTAPTPRTGHSGFLAGNRLIVFGGLKSKVSNNELWSLDLDTFTWHQTTPMADDTPWPSPRFEHSAVMVGSAMYVFGGSTKQSSFLNDLWRLDTDTLQWSKLTSDNTPSVRAGALLSDTPTAGEFVLYGGFQGDGGFDYLYESWTMKLEHDKASWTKVEPIAGTPPHPARPLCGIRLNDRLFVYGGYDPASKVPSNDLIFYDLTKRAWSEPIVLWLNSDNQDMNKAFASSKGLKPLGRYGHTMMVEQRPTDDGQTETMFTIIAGSGSSYLNDVVLISM